MTNFKLILLGVICILFAPAFGMIDSTEIYLSQANTFLLNSDYDQATQSIQKSVSFKTKSENTDLGNEYYTYAKVYNRKGELKQALSYLDSASFHFNNFPDKMAEIHLEKGRILKKLGNNVEAIKQFNQSLIIYENLNDTISIGTVELNMGNIYKNIHKTNEAKKYYFSALRKFEMLGNEQKMASCYNNIGNLYKKMNQLDSAKHYFIESINHRSDKDDILYTSYTYHNLANLYVDLEELDSALFYINESIKIKFKIGNQSDIYTDYLTFGEIYYLKKDYKNAEYYLSESLKDAKANNNGLNMLEIEKVLSQNYLAQKDYKNAAEHFNHFVSLQDSLEKVNFSESLENQFINFEMIKDSLTQKQLQLKQEITKSENENLILKEKFNRSQNNYLIGFIGIVLISAALLFISFRRRLKESINHKQVLEIQNEELKRTLISKEEKEVLLKEIHHRVKNNLQIINSLIRLQSHSMNEKNYIQKLSDTENRIRSMALIHEKLYQSNELSKLDVQSYIKDLVQNIYDSYQIEKPIDFEYEISHMEYSLDSLIPIGLIINEAVSNSIKYAFQGKDQGKIHIKLCGQCEPNKTVLIISDNGIGADLNFEDLSKNSLGLELIETLTDQLDGEFNLITENGFQYILKFPTLS
ncbi:MAG: histidine kinase dimerization/phosphoacceptor domain -containing protein [Putridiphycobacter sp.]